MVPLKPHLRSGALSLVAVLVCGVATPHSASGADGDLDTSFDSDGKVSSDFGNPFTGDFGNDIVIQPDGKIVIGGQTSRVSDLARYNPDGSLDLTFGGDGSSARSGISVLAIALQSDGKIVAAGGDTVIGTGVDFAVARFNADGSLDDGSLSDSTPGDSFGPSDGRNTTDFGDNDENAFGVAIQADGKIVLVGHRGRRDSVGDVDFAIARYNSNGSLDDGSPTDSTPGDAFGTAGKVRTDFAGDEDVARDVVIQPDQKIVVAGSREFQGNPAFAVARYLPDGTPDVSFDGDGRLSTTLTDDSFVNAVALQSNGKIVVAGAIRFGLNGSNFALARYNPNGSLDNSFGPLGNGRTFVDFAELGDDQANDLVLQSDGKIVAAGTKGSFTTNNADFALARFLPNGTLDPSFGTGGMVTTDFGAAAGAGLNGVALQQNGNIVTVGVTRNNQFNSGDVVLARYVATSLTSGIIQVKSITMNGNIPTLTVDAHTGYTFKLQVAESLSAGFTTVGAAQQGNTGTVLTFAAPPISLPSGFYRILIEPIGFEPALRRAVRRSR